MGAVAITVDVEGSLPTTCVFEAAKVVDVLAAAGEARQGLSYYSLVRGLADHFRKERAAQDDSEMSGIGIGVLWTAFNHPQTGEQMRRQVSAALRRDLKAHITWFFSPRHGLGLSVGERFVDLEQIVALTPGDRGFSYFSSPTAAEKPDA